jgi:hypothetical protein
MPPRPRPRHEEPTLRLRRPADVAALLRDAVPADLDDGELLLALDHSSYLCGIASRFPGDGDPVPELCADHLRLVADELHVDELVLVTFVAPHRITPSAADVARFEGLRVECRAAHVELRDHLLMSGHRWRAIAELTPLFGGEPCRGDAFRPRRERGGDHAA